MCYRDTLLCLHLGNVFFWHLGVLYSAESKILVVDAFDTAGPGINYFKLVLEGLLIILPL